MEDWGLPLALGAEVTDGSQVHLLRRLYETGMESDPGGAPEKEQAIRDVFATYPVVFG